MQAPVANPPILRVRVFWSLEEDTQSTNGEHNNRHRLYTSARAKSQATVTVLTEWLSNESNNRTLRRRKLNTHAKNCRECHIIYTQTIPFPCTALRRTSFPADVTSQGVRADIRISGFVVASQEIYRILACSCKPYYYFFTQTIPCITTPHDRRMEVRRDLPNTWIVNDR